MDALKVECILGKGTYGIVRLVKADDFEDRLALKCVSIDKINEMSQEDHILVRERRASRMQTPII